MEKQLASGSELANKPAVTRRVRAVAFAFVAMAVLPWMVILVLEIGSASVIPGAESAPLQFLQFISGTRVLAWAWTAFFIMLALVCGVESESKLRGTTELEAGNVCLLPETTLSPELADKALCEQAQESGVELLPEAQSQQEAEVCFRRGTELYRGRHFVEAGAEFDRALVLCPRLASAWAGKGLVSNAMGQYREAVQCYDEALRLDPRDPAVWYDKGNTLSAIGRLEGAIDCFDEALLLDPTDARAWHNRGVCLARLGRLDEAMVCYRNALALDPSYALAWFAQGVIEERLGHAESALTAYRQFLALAADGDAAAVEKVRQHVSALQTASQGEPVPVA
jgi:tetratricopeptide (TPR) repeat protein